MSLGPRRQIRVLHVDDDSSITELTATFLKQENERFTVETATSADEGLEKIEGCSPDCVVSDYNMPGVDGIEFLETVRDSYAELPFILFTGKGSEDVASDALRAGATDYIRKRAGSEQYELLANRIENAVEQSRSVRRAAALERVRTLVADVNQALVRTSSVDEVEAQVCQLISESAPYVTACFAGVNRETMQVEPRTWAGDAAGYFEELDMAVDEGSPGRHAPGGRAFHDRAIAISQDIRDDAQYSRWRDEADERGFRSLAVVPIEHQGELHGLLATFAARPNAFDETERGLLEELGDNVAHALYTQSLRTDLEQTNEELNTILEQAPVGFIGMDHDDGRFQYRRFNHRMEELSGRSSDEIRGKTPQEALGPEDGAEVANRYRECVERGEPVEYTSTFERAGERVVRKATVAPVATGGSVNQLVVVVQDVTEERRQRTQLEKKTARLEALFDRSPDMIDVHDTDGDILDVNQQLAEKIGYDKATLTEMKVWDLDAQATPGEARALWDEMDPDDRQQVEGVYQCRDGSTFPVEVNVRRLDIEDEELFVVISRDITEQTERERELYTQNERLEEFASIVSHDLRSPLTVAEGNLELARKARESEHLARAADAVDRSQALIDDLLTLARQGEAVAEVEPVTLADVAESCWHTVGTGSATLETRATRVIRADRSRLKQLLENLYRNSIEHGSTSTRVASGDSVEHGSTGRGPAAGDAVEHSSDGLTVSVGEMDDGFYVADTGPGIPEAEREEVFEAGYSTHEHGTGFGLRIVKQVADAHGWEVTVAESEGGGARFEVTGVEFADR